MEFASAVLAGFLSSTFKHDVYDSFYAVDRQRVRSLRSGHNRPMHILK